MSLFSKISRVLPLLRRSIQTSQSKRKRTPDPWDLATGLERWEAIQHSKGNVDPFLSAPVMRGPGTKECPNIIRSAYDKRVVACLCHPNNNHYVMWWLHEGFPRRCECNHWFVLERFEMPKIYEDVP